MSTAIEMYLSFGLEHKDGKVAYAGNHDERMSVFICGTSYNDRYGYQQGRKAHEELVAPNVDVIDMFDILHTDNGESCYDLDPNDANRLYMKIESYVTVDQLTTMLQELWPCIAGVYLSDVPQNDNPVCIKDIKIITKEITSKTNEFVFKPKPS